MLKGDYSFKYQQGDFIEMCVLDFVQFSMLDV